MPFFLINFKPIGDLKSGNFSHEVTQRDTKGGEEDKKTRRQKVGRVEGWEERR
jgi:hypothetical protein